MILPPPPRRYTTLGTAGYTDITVKLDALYGTRVSVTYSTRERTFETAVGRAFGTYADDPVGFRPAKSRTTLRIVYRRG